MLHASFNFPRINLKNMHYLQKEDYMTQLLHCLSLVLWLYRANVMACNVCNCSASFPVCLSTACEMSNSMLPLKVTDRFYFGMQFPVDSYTLFLS